MGEKLSYAANTGNHALFEHAVAKRHLHPVANRLPRFFSHLGIHAAIGNDLDIPIRQQQIYQHTIVVFGIPDAQLRENLYSSLLCSLPGQQWNQIQRRLDCKTYLPGVHSLGFSDRMLDRIQRTRRKGTPHCRVAAG